jgi:hypothetical protein
LNQEGVSAKDGLQSRAHPRDFSESLAFKKNIIFGVFFQPNMVILYWSYTGFIPIHMDLYGSMVNYGNFARTF